MDTKYNEQMIEEIYNKNLEDAYALLSHLQVAEGREPNINGLRGWVYEQTIHYCLKQELKLHGLSPKIEEQMTLSGGKKIDLLVDGMVVVVQMEIQ